MAISTSDEGHGPGLLTRLADRFRRWRDARIADPRFQAWAVANPLTRRLANRQGQALYDLVAGFVYSQILLTCVQLDLFRRLAPGPLTAAELSVGTPLSPDAMDRVMRAAAALDLIRLRPGARFGLGPLGAALLGAPGVEEMVRHHPLFYRDLADPVALLSAESGSTELARLWAYVDGDPVGAEVAGTYSELMAVSQKMVAAETLAACPLAGVKCLMDLGGGEGAFLAEALRQTPGLTGIVFDLPEVAQRAERRLAEAGLGDRARAMGGSFLDDPLPRHADAISLVRVLYDHDTAVVRRILRAAFAALPPGGQVIVSEPMSGGDTPTRAGDAYFGLYTAAMTSGQPRSAARHSALLAEAGFTAPQLRPVRQRFITEVVAARKPDRQA